MLALAACLGVLWPVVGPAAAEHLIAVVATKGSPHQPFGTEVVEGTKAAVARLNATGGVLGDTARVVAWSEDCSRERAIAIAEEIARLRPQVVVGHLCAGAAMAAAPVYAQAGILLIAPGVRLPALTASAHSGLVLRLAGRDDRFASDTVGFIARRYPGLSVALVADRTRQARGLAAGIGAELRRQQVALSHDERIESGEKSYDAVAASILSSGAGVVVMPAQPIELGVLVASLRRAGVEAPLVGSEILAVPSLITTAEQEAGRLVLMLPWTGLESAGEERTGRVAAGVGEQDHRLQRAARRRAEAAVEVWAQAAVRAKSAEPAAVASAAREAAAATVSGSIRFDAAGDAVIASYVPHVWRDGDWRPLEP